METGSTPPPTNGDRRPRRRRPRYAGTHPRRFEHRYKELQPEAYPEMQAHVLAQGRTPAGSHVPVLLPEVMEALQPVQGEIVADCTLGHGGHALELLRRIGPAGLLIGLDVDAAELERTRVRLAETGLPFRLVRSHFAGLAQVIKSADLDGVDIILADLGISSMQIDDPRRGFSYKHDGPLDMRMDDRLPRSARDLLAKMSAADLSSALHSLADEPDHEAIARLIAGRRRITPILRTRDLVDVVFQAKGLSRRKWKSSQREARPTLHPAARTFQALRILVNDELNGLRQFLRIVPYCLRPGGRVGIISFHSGEDRLVETAFREGFEARSYQSISIDPVIPTAVERRANPRCASARFRWAVRSALMNA